MTILDLSVFIYIGCVAITTLVLAVDWAFTACDRLLGRGPYAR